MPEEIISLFLFFSFYAETIRFVSMINIWVRSGKKSTNLRIKMKIVNFEEFVKNFFVIFEINYTLTKYAMHIDF